jgi:hypothetical protein
VLRNSVRIKPDRAWDFWKDCQLISEWIFHNRVNVHNLTQDADWRSLVKTSLGLQSCPLFQINRRPKSPRSVTFGQVYNLKEGTRLQLQRRFYQTAPICSLRQSVHIYPIYPVHVLTWVERDRRVERECVFRASVLLHLILIIIFYFVLLHLARSVTQGTQSIIFA